MQVFKEVVVDALGVVEVIPFFVAEFFREVPVAHVGEPDRLLELFLGVFGEGLVVLCPELLHELLREGLHSYSESVGEGDDETLKGDEDHHEKHVGKELRVVVGEHTRVEGRRDSLRHGIIIECTVHI